MKTTTTAALVLTAALMATPAHADVATDVAQHALLEALALTLTLDDRETAVRLAKALRDTMIAVKQITAERLSLTLQLEEHRVAQLRTSGDCIRSRSFDQLDADRKVRYADLRCPD